MFSFILKLFFFPFYLIYYIFIGSFKLLDFIIDTPLETDLSKIDNMDGVEFEKFVATLLKNNNFSNISITKASSDYGADIIATKNNYKYAIQCKRYSNKVGVAPIGEILRGIKKYKCDKGIIITNNFFTKQAIEEAKICEVDLWDRNIIKSIIETYKNPSCVTDNVCTISKEKLTLEQLDYSDYKNTALIIQQIYYNLGFHVKVVDVNTTDKYKTIYKCIHNIEDYSKISSESIGEKFIENLGIENVTLTEIDKKYFTINIPISISN